MKTSFDASRSAGRNLVKVRSCRRSFSVRLTAIALFLLIAPRLAEADIAYVYDPANRLIEVINNNTATATIYTYDNDGNVTNVNNNSTSTVVISEIHPNSGSVGTQVTVYGDGFSSTPGQNSVYFNGTQASVLSSTQTTIVTTVPTGATTGPVSVTTPNGPASGPTFTVH